MKKNKKEVKIKIFSTIFVIFVVFILIFNRFLLKAKNFLDELFLPFQRKIYLTSEKVSDSINGIFSYNELLNKNEELKKENMELKLLVSANENILQENERLVKLLDMKETNKNIKNLKFARVSYKNINNINSKFYIELGKDAGIEKNMIVLYDDYLIGRVAEVYDKSALVIMLTDENAKISVKSSTNLLGISVGSDEGKNEMYFQPSTFEENLEIGEEIFTSGLSDIYPEGLKVGEISEINRAENNLFKSIKIKPKFDSKDIKEVMIYKYRTN